MKLLRIINYFLIIVICLLIQDVSKVFYSHAFDCSDSLATIFCDNWIISISGEIIVVIIYLLIISIVQMIYEMILVYDKKPIRKGYEIFSLIINFLRLIFIVFYFYICYDLINSNHSLISFLKLNQIKNEFILIAIMMSLSFLITFYIIYKTLGRIKIKNRR